MKIVVAAVFSCICFGIGALSMLNINLANTFSFAASESVESATKTGDEINADATLPTHQPAVIVTLSSSDKLLADYKFVGAAVELPKTYLTIFESGMKTATEGMFHSKPAGAFCYFSDELKPDVLLCLPVVDLGPFLDNLRKLGTVKYNESLITFEPKMFPQAFMMQHTGDYLFISDSVNSLQKAPADPEALFSDMASTYHAAVKIQFDQIPDSLLTEYKEQLVSRMKDASKQAAFVQADDMTIVSEQLKDNLTETKELLIGLLMDQSMGTLALDVNLTATDESKIAQLNEMNAKIPATLFAGFNDPNAAMNLNICTAMLPEDATRIRESITRASEEFELSLPGEERETAEDKAFAEFMDELFESLEKTATNSHMDMGMSGTVRFDTTSEIVLGLRVDDPQAIESNFRRFLDAASKSIETENPIQAFPNVAQVEDIVFHQVVIEDGQSDPRAFGEQIRWTIGFGSNAVYLGLGETALTSLREKIENSIALQNSIVPAVRFNMRTQPFVKLVEPEAKDAFAHQMFMTIAGNDRIEFECSMFENSMNTRASLETGLLKVIWKSAEAKMNGTEANVSTSKPTTSTRTHSPRTHSNPDSTTSKSNSSSSSPAQVITRPKSSSGNSSSPTRVRNNSVPSNYHMIPQQTIPRNPKPPRG